MKDSVIIYSGGMDSTTLLYEYQDVIGLAITFDYGSLQNKAEQEYAIYNCKNLGINHIIIPLDFMHKYFSSSMFMTPDDIPEGSYDDQNMKSTVVPFRNGIMLSIACGIAESNGFKRVMIANHSGDHAIYPDCRQEFIDSMSSAMSAGTYENIKVCAPYTNLTKGEIALRGTKFAVDYGKTYSCYKGNKLHCGKCATCRERKDALNFANISDTTQYED